MIEWILDWWDGKTFGAARSPRWSQVRAQHIALYPNCACCGTKGSFLKPNEVHHKKPFHLNKLLELDLKNLITLCRRCHLLIGHLGSFQSFNIDVEVDARIIRDKIKNRP